MFGGRELEYGTILAIFERPQHPYTKGLLSYRPRLDTLYRRFPTADDFMTIRDKEGEIQLTEKPVDDARLRGLTTAEIGRLLHPESALATMGPPFEEGHHVSDDHGACHFAVD